MTIHISVRVDEMMRWIVTYGFFVQTKTDECADVLTSKGVTDHRVA
jgi:hypothetical protein